MPTFSARFGSLDRGRNIGSAERLAHLPLATRDWEPDESGAPAWISSIPGADRRPWSTIVPTRPLTAAETERWGHPWLEKILDDGPMKMPMLLRTPPLQPPWIRYRARRGAPRFEARNPEEAVYTAFLADVVGLGKRLIAQRLGFLSAQAASEQVERTARNKVTRRLRAGRLILHDDGVLPWAMWPDGELQPHWPHLPPFQMGLTLWFRLYATEPSSMPSKYSVEH